MPEPDRLTILDTHVWIWMVDGTRDVLSRAAIAAIEEAARVGAVRVSAISVWEVAMLASKGRISLSRAVEDWVQGALHAPGVRLLPLDPAIAVESARLPGSPHGDPADRILMASARVSGARLATCDGEIIEYAARGHISVLDCRA